MQSYYIVSYDISEPSRLRQVHKTVRDFGDGIQLSVYLCRLSKLDRALLERRLLDVIHQQQDQVIFIHLGAADTPPDRPPRCRILGRPLTPGAARSFVF
ncbi:MAG TPA: CRISPR-associated endonuclease Cas2 [Nannocystis exedens]|nr:CRISPR-associated endonuclease Cas2 [Nannocystis exedens]